MQFTFQARRSHVVLRGRKEVATLIGEEGLEAEVEAPEKTVSGTRLSRGNHNGDQVTA